jgi:hypothetical protein
MTEPEPSNELRQVVGPPPEMPKCPRCGEDRWSIEWHLVAKEDGTYSLAGAQPKVAAVQTPFLVCGNCGYEIRGKR